MLYLVYVYNSFSIKYLLYLVYVYKSTAIEQSKDL